ncbi:MAG: manganese efflux pump [Lachnospiraceae bacterium]|nr:manganese efflux pump [Lachnospiraceae bacterium]
MDAFSVSMANGLHDPKMKEKIKIKIAGTFAFFQFLMPMLGWMFVHFVLESFTQFKICIPWIALAMLLYIGGKMIYEAITGDECEDDSVDAPLTKGDKNDGEKTHNTTMNNHKDKVVLSNHELVIQGIATSIDALSVGFTIADYKIFMAFLCAIIIAFVTFIICIIGLKIGAGVGMRMAGKASLLGGVILIIIGIEIFVKGIIL